MLATQTFMLDRIFITQVVAIARTAGEAILAIYNASETTPSWLKSDESPLTAADVAAHNIIVGALAELLHIPIISEEAELPHFTERSQWSSYWLVDPLDGTKEFIARNGEFTVNIALVHHGVPVLGVVHVPVVDETYVGMDKSIAVDAITRAEKYHNGEKTADLHTRNLTQRCTAKHSLDVLASARHSGEQVAALLQKIAQTWPAPLQLMSAGSSLKFCWIAEGRADFYPRLAPTCEWDTAAAQAVLVAAGGLVVNATTFASLTCNHSESLVNPAFLALGDPNFDWPRLLK